MKIPRQAERRSRFLAAFNDMPRLETWATTHVGDEGESRERQHVKVIPRRVRRDMARIKSRREFRTDHGLPEP